MTVADFRVDCILDDGFVVGVNGGVPMKRFIEGEDRQKDTMLPEYLDDYIAADMRA